MAGKFVTAGGEAINNDKIYKRQLSGSLEPYSGDYAHNGSGRRARDGSGVEPTRSYQCKSSLSLSFLRQLGLADLVSIEPSFLLSY